MLELKDICFNVRQDSKEKEILKNINLDKYETAAVLARTEKEAFELKSLHQEKLSLMEKILQIYR